MGEDFGEIEPEELKFMFVPKKQISCMVKLINKSSRYIAFKVETTAPKLYCVRPDRGIVKPYSTLEVIVTRRASKVLHPSDVIAKQKFCIKRMFVSDSMKIEEVSKIFSSKDDSTDINEKILKVVVDILPKFEEMKSKSEELDIDAKEALEMKSKIKELDLRLTKTEETILKLKEQKSECDCKGKKTRHCMFIKCFNVKVA